MPQPDTLAPTGLGARIEIVRGKVEELAKGLRVDVLVSEPMGDAPCQRADAGNLPLCTRPLSATWRPHVSGAYSSFLSFLHPGHTHTRSSASGLSAM